MNHKKDVIVEPKTYNCLCSKCGYSWTSSQKPTKCPECKSKQIVFSEAEE